MASRFLPLFASLSFAFGPCDVSSAETGLALEPAPAIMASPFRSGDHLELHFATEEEMRITVLETTYWPWVRARCNQAPQPYETWINFTQVRSARRAGGQ